MCIDVSVYADGKMCFTDRSRLKCLRASRVQTKLLLSFKEHGPIYSLSALSTYKAPNSHANAALSFFGFQSKTFSLSVHLKREIGVVLPSVVLYI